MIITRGFGSRQSIISKGILGLATIEEIEAIAAILASSASGGGGGGYYTDDIRLRRDDDELLELIAHIATRGFLN